MCRVRSELASLLLSDPPFLIPTPTQLQLKGLLVTPQATGLRRLVHVRLRGWELEAPETLLVSSAP
ncbi:hypothetical protein CVT26_009686 [Gymnopilus dilepis]|uniref:Uncharacterized protein n=1 Tax=Gymnopilus dilepis TaxID=231916 RepID=A0A409YBV5_9AGAR|nr:hypothetical protein CVT26_009686 [Gymnopilus dilepis]